MPDNVNIHKTPYQDQVEAWDKYASAVLSAICADSSISEETAVKRASQIADQMLRIRIKKYNELKDNWRKSPV